MKILLILAGIIALFAGFVDECPIVYLLGLAALIVGFVLAHKANKRNDFYSGYKL